MDTRLRSFVGLLLLWTMSSMPRVATAQSFHDVAAGLAVGGISPQPLMDFALRASVGHEYAAGVGWQLDAFTTQFHFQSPTGGPISCSPDVFAPLLGPCSSTPGPASKGVLGVSAVGLVRVASTPGGARIFALGGVEADYLYLYTSALRPGASAGFEVAFPPETSGHSWSLDVRYHRLDTSVAPTWFIPVTVGLAF
jgi:hypothetical protein